MGIEKYFLLIISVLYLNIFLRQEFDIKSVILQKSSYILPSFTFCSTLVILTYGFNVDEQVLNFYFVEFYFLTILTIEDEKDNEISLFYLMILLLNKLTMIMLGGKFNLTALFLASIIYFSIYYLSKKSIGLGDIILNLILAIGMESGYEYYLFFTLTFVIGGLYSLLVILNGKYKEKMKIAFLKFIFLAYVVIIFRRYYDF